MTLLKPSPTTFRRTVFGSPPETNEGSTAKAASNDSAPPAGIDSSTSFTLGRTSSGTSTATFQRTGEEYGLWTVNLAFVSPPRTKEIVRSHSTRVAARSRRDFAP